MGQRRHAGGQEVSAREDWMSASAIPTGNLALAAKVRSPPLVSMLAFRPIQFRGCSESRKSPHSRPWGHATNGGFCQGQKRLSFVPNCNHNEPTGDIQACHSKPSLFAGATSCSAQTGHSRADTMLRRSPSERSSVHRAAFCWMKRRSADKTDLTLVRANDRHIKVA